LFGQGGGVSGHDEERSTLKNGLDYKDSSDLNNTFDQSNDDSYDIHDQCNLHQSPTVEEVKEEKISKVEWIKMRKEKKSRECITCLKCYSICDYAHDQWMKGVGYSSCISCENGYYPSVENNPSLSQVVDARKTEDLGGGGDGSLSAQLQPMTARPKFTSTELPYLTGTRGRSIGKPSTMKTGPFSKEDDAILKDQVRRGIAWVETGQTLKRSPKSCEERYFNLLSFDHMNIMRVRLPKRLRETVEKENKSNCFSAGSRNNDMYHITRVGIKNFQIYTVELLDEQLAFLQSVMSLPTMI
jgi:hypothetical protein